MIVRIWRGYTPAEKAEEYAALISRTGLRDYEATPGNRGAMIVRREERGTAEFLVVSFWEDFDAIRRFAGPDPEKAVYYPEDEAYLLGKETRVAHYEVAAGSLPSSVAAKPVAGRA
jgi:heme-degrading monooxygenase HmoA